LTDNPIYDIQFIPGIIGVHLSRRIETMKYSMTDINDIYDIDIIEVMVSIDTLP
jgi:hypothetical protein